MDSPSAAPPSPTTHPRHILHRAALVGAGTAVPGFAIGAVYGTLRTPIPTLFAIVSGAQCFAIGTTFWTVRTSLLNRDGLLNWWHMTRGLPSQPRTDLAPSRSDRLRASTIAGSSTGFLLGFVFRGPQNVIPGTIMFTLFGWGGQRIYNFFDARNSQTLSDRAQIPADDTQGPDESILERLAKSRWSPIKILPDEEYESILHEKILKLEAEIAIVDDKLQEFREKARQLKAQQPPPKTEPNPINVEQNK